MKRTFLIGGLIVVTMFGAGTGSARAANFIECFQTFMAEMEHCATIRSTTDRAICGGEAELELVICGAKALAPWK